MTTKRRTQRTSRSAEPQTPPLSGVTHKTLPLALLVPHPDNYRKHPRENVERIAASLVRFGQVRDIVVQATADATEYLIVAGHGVVSGARSVADGAYPNAPEERRAQLQSLHAVVIPVDWSPAQVKGYLIADNETTRSAEDDEAVLAQLLEEQEAAGFELESVGFSDDDLAQLLADLEGADDEEEGGHTRSTDLHEPKGGDIPNTFNVVIECADEAEQRRAYALAQREGFSCRILTL